MARLLPLDALLFLLPFAAYAVWLAFARGAIGAAANWPLRTVGILCLAGTALVTVGLLTLVSFSGSPPDGQYHPATLRDGQVVPGSIR